MRITYCASVGGGQAGDTADVDDERASWLVAEGYAVVEAAPPSPSSPTPTVDDTDNETSAKKSPQNASRKKSNK